MSFTFVVNPKLEVVEVRDDAKWFEPAGFITGSGPQSLGFAANCVKAYNEHHHLVIDPNAVWLAIMTQMSVYINLFPEQLRSKFVKHSDKKELVVRTGGTLRTADYEYIGNQMAEKMKEHLVDESIVEWAIPNFSTTTPTDRAVGSMVLMCGLQKFFKYKAVLKCGLPKVTILGTVEDWEFVRVRAYQAWHKYNMPENNYMQKWHEMLTKVLGHFVKTAQKSPDLDFWNKMCSFQSRGSGTHWLAGWITCFSVFDANNKWVGDLHEINHCGKKIVSEWPIVDIADLNTATVSCDLLVDDNGTEYNTTITAGVCARQQTAEMRPSSAWMLTLREPTEKQETKRQRV
jgi:hypothetical protein